MFWYWFLGAIVVLLLTLVFSLFMMKKTESVLIGEVWGVFGLIVFVLVYFLLGALLR